MDCSPEWAPPLPALRYVVWRYTGSPRLIACHKTAAAPAPTPLTLAVAPVLPVDEALRRLDSTEAGLTSDGADARRARFGPNVLTSHRVTALGVLTRQLRNLAPWAFPLGHRGGRPPDAPNGRGRLHERLTEAVAHWVFSTPDKAGQAAKRFPRCIAEATASSHLPGPASVSAGVAGANLGEPMESVIERADKALYRAKRAGGTASRWTPTRCPRPSEVFRFARDSTPRESRETYSNDGYATSNNEHNAAGQAAFALVDRVSSIP